MENKEKELKKQNKGRGWIYNKVPRNTLVLLSKSPLTITEISKETDSQYSSVLKVIKMLEENGLIQTEKRGRIRIVWLTEFGEKISNLFKRIDNMIEKA
ncbi:MAG TPA: ArsR family transcriptional regulator [Candidatus Aenigmarchaeota archaeon]|nr:ArsR family transcriptional regulator [Candidatus Aenigmarchaeota archaeon]